MQVCIQFGPIEIKVIRVFTKGLPLKAPFGFALNMCYVMCGDKSFVKVLSPYSAIEKRHKVLDIVYTRSNMLRISEIVNFVVNINEWLNIGYMNRVRRS